MSHVLGLIFAIAIFVWRDSCLHVLHILQTSLTKCKEDKENDGMIFQLGEFSLKKD